MVEFTPEPGATATGGVVHVSDDRACRPRVSGFRLLYTATRHALAGDDQFTRSFSAPGAKFCPHDPNAVAVFVGRNKVGYLSREDATRLRPAVIRLISDTGKPIALSGVLAGGGPREDSRVGNLGVWLSYDPADFA